MRSSGISSKLLGWNQSEIAELKAKLAAQQAEITAIKSGGVGVDQAALGETLKPLQDLITVADKSAKDALTGVNSVDDKVNLLAGVVDTNSTNTTTRLANLTAVITDAKAIAIANDSKISNLENVVPSRDELTLAVAGLPKKADIDALTQRMVTAENLLNKKQELRFNRSPSNTDSYEIGTVWADVSFGEQYPLRFISVADGVWQFLNEIKLRAIRVFVTSVNASFPQCRNVRFVDKNGATIPYNNWIVGARSAGFYAPAQGSIYTGGGSQEPPSKTTGWFELEPASGFDYTRGIKEGWASLRADTASTSLAKIELHFNSGAIKSITSTQAWYAGDKQFFILQQPEEFQYGSSVAALMGEQLTAGKLADANSNDYGRISGAALNSAIQQIVSPTAKSPSQADFESLVNRIAQLESRLP